jgi:hypothetical protein
MGVWGAEEACEEHGLTRFSVPLLLTGPFEIVSARRDGEAPRPTLFTETAEVR